MTRADGSPVAECIIDWELVDRKSRERSAGSVDREELRQRFLHRSSKVSLPG